MTLSKRPVMEARQLIDDTIKKIKSQPGISSNMPMGFLGELSIESPHVEAGIVYVKFFRGKGGHISVKAEFRARWDFEIGGSEDDVEAEDAINDFFDALAHDPHILSYGDGDDLYEATLYEEEWFTYLVPDTIETLPASTISRMAKDVREWVNAIHKEIFEPADDRMNEYLGRINSEALMF